MKDYKKILVWEKAHVLVLKIYSDAFIDFPKDESFRLVSQIKRAAYSIPLNIVEGAARNTEKDFAHFLDIALASCVELEYALFLAKDLGFLPLEKYQKFNDQTGEVKAMLIGFIKKIRR